MDTPLRSPLQERRVGHRLAFGIVAVLILFTAVLLPFAVSGVFGDLLDPPTNRVYTILRPEQPGAASLRLHLDIISLDEVGRTASVRVSGHQTCAGACSQAYQLVLVSTEETPDAEGLPPSATFAVPAAVTEVTNTITLPVSGAPIRYPFDDYGFGFGVVLQTVQPDGTAQELAPDAARALLWLSLQTHVGRAEMSRPESLGANAIDMENAPATFLTIRRVTFERPLYLKILTILLLLLIAAAAAFAVFMRPLDQLVTNVGALVVGIWGVRAILVGTDAPPGATAVDLSLSMVILFLLAAIAVRALTFLDERSELYLLQRLRGSPRPDPAAADASPAAQGHD